MLLAYNLYREDVESIFSGGRNEEPDPITLRSCMMT